MNRLIKGRIRPPRLCIDNEKIVLRHMIAIALSAFFRQYKERYKTVETLLGDWNVPRAVEDLVTFCVGNNRLARAMRNVVPKDMHHSVGLLDDSWIVKITGTDSRFARVEAEVCADYCEMKALRNRLYRQGKDSRLNRVRKRMDTIAGEQILNFLSRKAVIPKYGFPVDVVELDTRSTDKGRINVSLQRDLSQAIAEYAPGGKIVADKVEWESCGVKTITGKEWPVRYYHYDDARTFMQWNEDDQTAPVSKRKYLIPEFGFVTPLFKKPGEPRGRTGRLYTTRPFFRGFDRRPMSKHVFGIEVTRATPGTLVILCEGKKGEGFYICRRCGAHMTQQQRQHKTPVGSECAGSLGKFSLGHELVTDVVRLRVPSLVGQWDAYSIAYAMLFGAADSLGIPETDLNVTIGGSEDDTGQASIVLYDNVPGGAGLVAQIEREDVFKEVLECARERTRGGCGCDVSCYGCLRSYRNQFAHPYLDRKRVSVFLCGTD